MRTKCNTLNSNPRNINIMGFAMRTIRQAFSEYIADGNACMIDGQWSTQESMWTARFKTKQELFIYFKREYHGLK